uniref:Uncharacterized protein n=1 Tax=Lactuca sativa TaxID=4236 RepID=A0A9R1V7M9_LACSA|nr:hypothetical protein LSAT_V11C600338980 [Lactuca sativa]
MWLARRGIFVISCRVPLIEPLPLPYFHLSLSVFFPITSSPFCSPISLLQPKKMAIRCNCGAEVVIRISWSKNSLGKPLLNVSTLTSHALGFKFIGWVVEDQKCACMNIRLKLEQQNLKMKLYIAISLFLFFSILVYKV